MINLDRIADGKIVDHIVDALNEWIESHEASGDMGNVEHYNIANDAEAVLDSVHAGKNLDEDDAQTVLTALEAAEAQARQNAEDDGINARDWLIAADDYERARLVVEAL